MITTIEVSIPSTKGAYSFTLGPHMSNRERAQMFKKLSDLFRALKKEKAECIFIHEGESTGKELAREK